MTPNCNFVNSLGTCVICNSGYYLTTVNTCSPIPPFCNSANSLGCNGCVSGYELVNRFCTILQPNCLIIGNNDLCTVCNSGYYLTSLGTCVALPLGCVTAALNGVCTVCEDGLALNAGVCT